MRLSSLNSFSLQGFPGGKDRSAKGCGPSQIIYSVACALFRALAMMVCYSIVRASCALRNISFVKPLARSRIRVPSLNIANVSLLPKCIASALWPEPKSNFNRIGKEEGVRITHDLILRPANGLCLGKSLAFLSASLLGQGPSSSNNLIKSAKTVQGAGCELSVRLQAIYDGLMGMEAKFSSQEREFFSKILRNKHASFISQNDALLSSILFFLNQPQQSVPLREFVLDDMELKNKEIDPNSYALLLELDALWSHQVDPLSKKNDCLHNAIVQAVARCVQIDLKVAKRYSGQILSIAQQVKNLPLGSYLMQFSNHSVSCVKVPGCLGLFDPSEGLALYFDSKSEQDGIVQLLKYYGNRGSVSLNVLKFQKLLQSTLSSFD